MVHQGQGLTLGLEPGDDLSGIHPGLDELDGHQALHRLGLLGHPDGAHAAFADLLNQLVRTDEGAGRLARRCWFRDISRPAGGRRLGRGILKKAAGRRLRTQQRFDPSPQGWLIGASQIKVSGAVGRRFL